MFSQYRFTRSEADYASYALKRNQVKSLITTAKVQHDKLLIQNLTSNPKALYGYVRDKSKVKTFIDQLEKPDGSLTDNESKVVGVLNDFFQSAGLYAGFSKGGSDCGDRRSPMRGSGGTAPRR